MKEKKLNLNINDGPDFFAHESAINFGPTQFILDFKSVTPRNDPRAKDGAVLCLRHNIVMMDPFHAKHFLGKLTKMMETYEKEYGKIDKPKAIKKFEKKHKGKKVKAKKADIPTYLG